MTVFLTPDAASRSSAARTSRPTTATGCRGFPRVLHGDRRRVSRRDAARSASISGADRATHLPRAARRRAGRRTTRERRRSSTRRRGAPAPAASTASHGGFGGAPKFPHPMTLESCCAHGARTGDADDARAWCTLTLDKMAGGGIYDQLGGGFARYSDRRALAGPALREDALRQRAAGARLPRGLPRDAATRATREVARETLDFVLARDDRPTTAASTRRWTPTARARRGASTSGPMRSCAPCSPRAAFEAAEVDAVARAWDVTRPATGRRPLDPPSPARRGGGRRAARSCAGRAARRTRALACVPGATTSSSRRGTGWRCAPSPTRRWCSTSRATGSRPRSSSTSSRAAWSATKTGCGAPHVTARPHACLRGGLPARWPTGCSARTRRSATAQPARAREPPRGARDRRLLGPGGEVFAETGSEHERAIAPVRSLVDGAMPATNSVAADLLPRLAPADRRGGTRPPGARRSCAAWRRPSIASRLSFGRMLAAADRGLRPPVDAVIAAADPARGWRHRAAGRRRDARTRRTSSWPGSRRATGRSVADLRGKVPRGKATAYVCRGYACEAPTEDPEIVTTQVAAISRGGS